MGIRNIKLFSGMASIAGLLALAVVATPAIAAGSSTVVVTPANNQGWAFNPDPDNTTPYNFTEDEQSVGAGSLYVQPISSEPARKFIAEKQLNIPVSDFNSLSYDFLIAGTGTEADADQYYLNVYANISSAPNYYDCRYDYVPTIGSTDDFTTASFSSTGTPTDVVRRGSSSLTVCPPTLAQMPEGSYIRAFTLNLGDTSASDAGLAGYFDKVVVSTTASTTTYDFELREARATNKDECKNGGYMNFSANYKNQGQCVSSVVSKRQ